MLALTIVLFGIISIAQMAIDIFPSIDIPIVSCIWTYTGMSPYYMENLVTTVTERALTSTVNGISHIESASLSGMSIVKVYLNQGTPMGASVATVTSVGNAILRTLPRGISPPFVTASSATDVPVLQLAIRSDKLSESVLFDIANNLVRSQLATVQGATIPFPYGGKYRQVMVDLDPKALNAYRLSAADIVQIIKDQNVVNPTGTAKFGSIEYVVALNDMPDAIEKLNRMPVKVDKGAVVFLKDVAQVRDGYQPQTNIVNIDGKRAVLFNVLKSGKASTLSVVQGVKNLLPRLRQIVPLTCKIDILTDQSIFVKDCIFEVVREAATAAGLTALMMLAILGSWRSTLIVATSIPLAILCAMIGLHILGQTVNSMTLGGLALAVGMLVDDATVEIENVHRNMAMGKEIVTAIMDGAQQVAMPALVSTLSICIVFIPLLMLTEPSRSLFVPLGMSVVIAMLSSYGLSRTVVPLMSKALLAKEDHSPGAVNLPGFLGSIHVFVENIFEGAREHYKEALDFCLNHHMLVLIVFGVFYVLSFGLLPFIGREYFPTIDSGQLRLHVVASPGTRVEETERIFKLIEKAIRNAYPAEVETVVDNIGLPVSPINYAYSDSQTISEADGEILVTLSEHRKHATDWYQAQIRKLVGTDFPQCSFYFQPADIVTQILNAGLPAPIDVRILGMKRSENYAIAQNLKRELRNVPGAQDVCLHQVVDAPHFLWTVDRTRSRELGLTQGDISNSFLTSLSSSFQTSPNFWLNQKSGVSYNLAVQTPQRSIATLQDMNNTSVTDTLSPGNEQEEPGTQAVARQYNMLINVAVPTRVPTPAVVNHLNVQPSFDIFAACQGRDLGSVSRDMKKIIDVYQLKLPRGSRMFMGGQVMSMKLAFIALFTGLVLAVVLVYLLLVVNFQSWTAPLIILMAIPGAFSGIIWSLFVTQTDLSIPALMGAIMTIGVASANSILMITFANEELATGLTAKAAALSAGYQRFRPVIMTATAMIIGMIPMAIGSGEGGSQNAPIGRAVIGGLLVATFSTLLFVPLVFSLSHTRTASRSAE